MMLLIKEPAASPGRGHVGARLVCALPKCGTQMKVILKHLEMWPIEYPDPCPIEARASPQDFGLLQKLTDSRHLK